MEGQEQNRSEEPTPFKLRRAREKGQVARGMDLGFVGSLLALAAFIIFAGQQFVTRLGDLMRISISSGIDRAEQPTQILSTVASVYWLAFKPLLLLCLAIVVILIFLELLQLRGFIFSTQPLKPDFSRLNPAKGLKRLFSLRMLKETLKNVIKMAVYSVTTGLLIWAAIGTFGPTLDDASSLAIAMESGGKQLLFTFIGLAFFFMVIDQMIVRREFHKQMRMSRREVTREHREQEGEPRLKQKRKEIHKQMREQAAGLGNVQGSDFLITNPEHFAVALKYDAASMDAPVVRSKGRNHFAQLLKRKARLVSVPVYANPPLARALYRTCSVGQPIPSSHYQDVARLYMQLRQNIEVMAD
ncbi:MAG: EscU/YscU/HrcU family type III secretion system export apparatus switch protein [Sphingorhabdus sp.]|uniref:EscU/YscU/HrcU family type III secretion system export apparatus switch protein n=1 Tax=Sphingorhabdus sp. TaxID=1902408 RepID=UPI003CA31CDF